MPEPVRLWLADAAARLAAAGIEHPIREARLLLTHALGITREALLMGPDRPVPEAAGTLLDRRCRREPLALIIGAREFWSLKLHVSPATLVPRPDSESLVEAALTAFPVRDRIRRVLDLGTGTGCLLLAVLSEFPASWGLGVDASEAAVRLARHNAASCGLAHRACFIAGDWGAALRGTFDLILCNPPYIATAAIAGLMPEVAQYEPATALDGGADGLAAYRRLVPQLPALLAAGGAAILELGAGQEGAVAALADGSGLSAAGCHRDLGGIARAQILCHRMGAGLRHEKNIWRMEKTPLASTLR